jgi:hypothetical protein
MQSDRGEICGRRQDQGNDHQRNFAAPLARILSETLSDNLVGQQFIEEIEGQQDQRRDQPPAITGGVASAQAAPINASSGNRNPKTIEQSDATISSRNELVK